MMYGVGGLNGSRPGADGRQAWRILYHPRAAQRMNAYASDPLLIPMQDVSAHMYPGAWTGAAWAIACEEWMCFYLEGAASIEQDLAPLLDWALHQGYMRARVLLARSAGEPPGRIQGWALARQHEILSWERDPERGVLHDPPHRWYPISTEAYWGIHWLWNTPDVPWPRVKHALALLADVLPVKAYGIATGERSLAGALLLWHPEPGLVHVLDLIWHPKVGARNVGRYLLQELYMRHPRAWVALDLVSVRSPLNPVLAALGYHVYHRRQELVWVYEG